MSASLNKTFPSFKFTTWVDVDYTAVEVLVLGAVSEIPKGQNPELVNLNADPR